MAIKGLGPCERHLRPLRQLDRGRLGQRIGRRNAAGACPLALEHPESRKEGNPVLLQRGGTWAVWFDGFLCATCGKAFLRGECGRGGLRRCRTPSKMQRPRPGQAAAVEGHLLPTSVDALGRSLVVPSCGRSDDLLDLWRSYPGSAHRRRQTRPPQSFRFRGLFEPIEANCDPSWLRSVKKAGIACFDPKKGLCKTFIYKTPERGAFQLRSLAEVGFCSRASLSGR